ncbi:MAG: DUF6599 family protein [Bryobacteraceae bacterium]
MSRSCCLALLPILFCSPLFAASDAALWREYGLAGSQSLKSGADQVTAYRMNDPTGAIAAWEWLRTAKGHPCGLGSFCTAEPGRTVVAQENYVLAFSGPAPNPAQFETLFATLPDRRDTALPSILSFLPTRGLVPDSARYVLGPVSYQAFAPELSRVNPGFNQEVEAQAAEYRIGKSRQPVRLVLFYYPAPGMARQHMPAFQRLPGTYVKRSVVLLGVVSGAATRQQAETLLSRVKYKAQIVMDAVPAPSPIKPLYSFLLNVVCLSALLIALCIAAGLMYAGMRLYRRHFGTLDADEAMITLHLGGNWK